MSTLSREAQFTDFEFAGASIGKLGEIIESGNAEEAYRHLEEYYERRRNEIERELIADFPKREKILRVFFKLHDDGIFEASVLLGLAQADGIAHDIFGAELYRVKGGASLIRAKIDKKKVDWVWEALAEPLRAALPIALHVRPGSQNFNRNTILHGTNLDYGTKRNSFRTISLLSYLRGMSNYEKMALRRSGG